MNRKNISKSFIVLLLVFALLVAQIPVVSPLVPIYAEEILTAPENVWWKEGALATAKWDAVEGADYYVVDLSVYANDELIGTNETGTDETETDVQQQIRALPLGDIDKVDVSFCVKAINTKNDTTSSFSSTSGFITYYLSALETLDAPTDIVLGEDGILSFKLVDGAEYYVVTYHIDGDGGWCTDTRENSYVDNGYMYIDLSDGLEDYYLYRGYMGEHVTFYAEVESLSPDGRASAVSDKSNDIDYYLDGQLEKPSIYSVEEDDGHYWFYFKDDNESVDHYDFELVMQKYYNRDSEDIILAPDNKAVLSVIRIDPEAYESFTVTEEPGIYKLDVLDILRYYYYSGCMLDTSKPVDIGIRIRCVASVDDTEIFSTYSFRYTIEDFRVSALIDTIQDPVIKKEDSSYILSFLEIPDAEGYDVEYHIRGENIYVGAGKDFPIDNCKVIDGVCYIDLTQIIADEVYVMECEGQLLYFSVSVRAYGDRDKYEIAPYSNESDELRYYRYGDLLEDIILSPETPILAVGHSMYLGKTVVPINGYYESIVWTSDNEEAVSVDEEGKITALSVGSAVITAVVDDSVTKSVTVNTYEVNSNIENGEEAAFVEDTAGTIIDDIGNNDSPDISNTDISESELDEIKESIHEGVENGDTFHTDIRYIQKTFDSYKNNWGQIQKAAGELNTAFAGAYNIEVEMYHKNKDGAEYHIGNITKLDNEITFTIDLVGNSGNYVLVRVHKNANGEDTYDVIDYTVDTDGNLIVKSDKFSDFILLTEEENTVIEKQEKEVKIQEHDALTYGNESVEFKVEIKDEGKNALYKWSSSNSSVITVDETTGKAKAVGAGDAIIKVEYDSEEYYGTGSLEVHVNCIKLTITGIKPNDKTYDGNTTATLDYTDAIITGILEGDEVSYTAAGVFDSAEVGPDKEVLITYTLSGKDSGNYVVDSIKTNASINAVADVVNGDTTSNTTEDVGSTGGSTSGSSSGSSGGSSGGSSSGSSGGSGTISGNSNGNISGTDAESSSNKNDETKNEDTKGDEGKNDDPQSGENDEITIKKQTSSTDVYDGKTVTTNATIYSDGLQVTEKVVKYSDGSSVTTTVTSKTDGTKLTEKIEKKADGTLVTTSTTKDADGNSITEKTEVKTDGTNTTTKTIKDADGASITNKVVEKPDGSITDTLTEKDADGNVLSTSKTVTKTKEDGSKTITSTAKNADGSNSTSKTTVSKDGSSKTNITRQNADGSTTKEKIEEKADGSITGTSTTTDEDGNVLSTEKLKVTVSKSGTETATTIVENADGSLFESVVKTKADGTASSTVTETDADGNVLVSVGSTKKDGSGIVKSYALDDDGVVLVNVDATTVTASIPASVKVNGKSVPVTSIGDGALKGNESVRTVKIADSVTSIGEGAFEGAKSLKTIKLSANVTEIAPAAFEGISSKATFYITAETDEEFNDLVDLIKKSGVGSKVKFKRA